MAYGSPVRRQTARILLALIYISTYPFILSGCTKPSIKDARYDPAANILEIIAVLRRHIPDDTYQFEPARDFTGRNVYRASLLRLENFEAINSGLLRSGYMMDAIAFSKGRALERLRAFDLASEQYKQAARYEGELQIEALKSAALCDAFAEAAELEVSSSSVENRFSSANRREFTKVDQRRALLETLGKEVQDTHYESVLNEEMERTDSMEARRLESFRRTEASGNLKAIAARQQLVIRHRGSKNANRHLLALADLYATLAHEYIEEHPPESLKFEPANFEELVSSAARLYEAVSNQDGAIERIEAAQRLESFLAFTLRVDRDRFTP